MSVIAEHDLFAARYLKISANVGFGDSGGPLFYKGAEVAMNSVLLSARRVAPDHSYRLDASRTHDFLAERLEPSSFVALPWTHAS